MEAILPGNADLQQQLVSDRTSMGGFRNLWMSEQALDMSIATSLGGRDHARHGACTECGHSRSGEQLTSSTFCIALTDLCTSSLLYLIGLLRCFSISKVVSCVSD